MHDEHVPGEDGHRERAETYLRLLAEAVLRPTADGNAGRVQRAADILVDAGVLTEQLAAQIVSDVQLALRLRQRTHMRRAVTSSGATAARIRRLGGFRPADEAHGQVPWRVLPTGPATPGAHPMALILTKDRLLAPTTLYFPPTAEPPESGVPPFAQLTGTDDLGTSYRIGFSDGCWAGSAWTGTIMFHPAPPEAARWIAIMSRNGQLLRADLTAAPAAGAAPAVLLEPVTESPGERLLTRQGEAMLAALAIGYPSGHSRASLAEAVATLEGAGALSPLSLAPARMAALGQLLGLPTEGPADEVPARWRDVITHYGRRRRLVPVTGTAAIAADLPDLGGTRFAIAGLRSGGGGTFLHVVVKGVRPMPRRRPGPPVDTGFSWWLRDDADGWHLATLEDVSPVGGPEGLLRLALLPPLGHATSTLTVQVTGQAQQATATLPVRW